MFLLFLPFTYSLFDPSYSLIPPFIHTSIGEIGNWSIRGHAVSQKKIIHLTSSIGGMNGGVCQLVPTNSNDWAAELEMAFHGDTIVFTYGKQLCPNVTSRFFNAFNLSFTPITDRKQVRVHLSGPEVFPFADCNFDYNFYPEKVRIRIEKQNKNLTVSTITNTGMEKKCFTQKLSDFL